ncbi:MAG: bifunctional diaminohydroxyphosphoribosylaminopyrimidine deaminase/5-amino-6-(5-phosphoribosylamino)uracil reductase RibD [Eubacterium sp.]|nr:bifunctional diaminohydroxyphosphoribosylaminopyrimidine deaminase/5-amino-6-(5-phosphoribosylamino)uracil reductase RibD [Candidatus Colimonas fimequi]
MTDREYMQRAIDLAVKGCGHTNPNPMVGAVIVKDGKIVAEGYHEKYGDLHAERNALTKADAAGINVEGATMYVTLEPCCHYGKQPPCTEAIIEHKIAKVVVGSNDPNPQVAGKGFKILREAGIEVVTEFMKEECDAINTVFFHYIQTGLPYVVMKYAMTADGKIATRTGAAKWITGEAARKRVHEDRNRYASILVGIGTVLSDDPLLTSRIDGAKNPTRIVVDSHLRIPLDCKIVQTANEVPTIIATSSENIEKENQLIEAGCEILSVSEKDGRINLRELVKYLGEMKIDSLYIEGGAQIHWAALNSRIVDKVHTYIAPKLFGGNDAPSPIGGLGCDVPDNGVMLTQPQITLYGDDILLESEVIK